MNVAFINGFVPTFGETFDFLTADGGVNGQFAEVDSTYTLAIHYSADGVSLTVVPEPTGIGLLAVSAGLLLRRRRKMILLEVSRLRMDLRALRVRPDLCG